DGCSQEKNVAVPAQHAPLAPRAGPQRLPRRQGDGRAEASAPRRPEDRHVQGPPGPDAEGRLGPSNGPVEGLKTPVACRPAFFYARRMRAVLLPLLLMTGAPAVAAPPPVTSNGWGDLRIGLREAEAVRRFGLRNQDADG